MNHDDPQTLAQAIARRFNLRFGKVPTGELEAANSRLLGSGWCICRENGGWHARPAAAVEGLMLSAAVESGGVYLEGRPYSRGMSQ